MSDVLKRGSGVEKRWSEGKRSAIQSCLCLFFQPLLFCSVVSYLVSVSFTPCRVGRTKLLD